MKHQAWHTWLVLVLTFILTTTGLAVALFSILRWHEGTPWPWVHTDEVLLIGVCCVVLGFCLYLTATVRTLRALEEEQTKQVRAHFVRLIGLLNVSRIMSSEVGLSKVFDGITRACLEHFDCQQASLMLTNQATGDLEVVCAAGHESLTPIIGTSVKRGEGIAGWVAEKNKPVLLGNGVDQDDGPQAALIQPSLSAAIVVPICVRDRVVGVLNVASRDPGVRYGEEELSALQVFAENAGTCIRHIEHVQWMAHRIEKLEDRLRERTRSTESTGFDRGPAL